MRRILTITALLSVIGASPAAAGPYASVSGGAAFLADSDLEVDGIGGAEAEFDTGFGVTGAFGWAWDTLALSNVRTELELGYRSNELDSISVGGTTGGDAEVNALSGMANVAVDLDIGSTFQPYVMGGLGLANLELENDDTNFEEDDTVFAYQLGAGIIVPLGAATLFGGYRFFGTSNPEFEDSGSELEAEYNSHNLEVGVRFGF